MYFLANSQCPPRKNSGSGAMSSDTIHNSVLICLIVRSYCATSTQLRHPEKRGYHRGAKVGVPTERLPISPSNHQCRHFKGEQLSTHVVKMPQGGSLLVGVDGVRKSQFPRGCQPAGWVDRIADRGQRARGATVAADAVLSKSENDVVTRLSNPKTFTGTAATGHLPITVDLEGGVGVSHCCFHNSCRVFFAPQRT